MLGQYIRTHTNPPVFLISGALSLLLVALTVIFPSGVGTVAGALNGWITTNLGWFYIFAASFMLIFVVGLMFTRWGRVRLGPDGVGPEYGNWAWFSMMFTAGMGIGLVYYAVSEPVGHFNGGLPAVEAGSQQASTEAMNFTFFHWGLHPWAIYIVLGLSMAYFSFRRGLPLRPASVFYPLIGDRIYGWFGNAVDIVAVFGALFGLATSIGIGATQIGTGLETLFSVPNSLLTQVLIIVAVEVVAITSVMLGLDAGIRRLAIINMWLAIGLAALVFAFGPWNYLLESLAGQTGYYIQNLPQTSFQMFAGNSEGQDFQASWTLFYWAWWISWSPFVGMFVARISRGRTIRQFIVGTLLVPTGVSMVWFVIFGNTAIYYILNNLPGSGAIADSGYGTNTIFLTFEALPIGGIGAVLFGILAIVVVTLFFATSSDSGSLVVDILTNGGDPEPNLYQRLFWATMEGLIALVLLVAGTVVADSPTEAISALQAASLVTGLPFGIVLLFMCYCLIKGLQQERLPSIQPEPGVDTIPPEPGRAATRQSSAPAPQRMSGYDSTRDRGQE